MEKSKDLLLQYWGFQDFRPLQEEIVDSVIYGHDTLAILPTGGGKSICFQVPGMALEGVTIVISPLIALMEDQVRNLRSRGIEASMITSVMSYREIDITLDNARFGRTKFLYTSPERLKSPLFHERFKSMNIGLIVVDEAHVYLKNKNARKALEELLRLLRSKGVIVVMLSQGVEDYKTKDFDFASQVKLPICLNIQNKDYRMIESFVGTPNSKFKLEAEIKKLDSGLGLINLSEPKTITLRQFWKTIKDS